MQNINLDITPGDFWQVLRFSQGDIGREFKINVVDFDIPAGATAKIVGKKPGGLGFTINGTIAGNIVTFKSTEDLTSEWGRFVAELKIEYNDEILGTANFYFEGEKNPHPDGTVDGTPDNPVIYNLEQIITEATDAWLDEHPEATTTVEDHSLSIEKMVVGTLGYVTPGMFGAKGDGLADDTSAFLELADYCNNGKASRVFIPKGNYIINSPVVFTKDVEFYGDGKDTVLDCRGIISNPSCISFEGATISVGTTTALANQGDLIVSLSSVANLSVGDLITIYDTTDGSWSSERTYYRKGEFCFVASISGTDVTLLSPLLDSYVSGCVITKIEPITTNVHDLYIKVYDAGASISPIGISVSYGKDITINNIYAEGSNDTHLNIAKCINVVIGEIFVSYYSANLVGYNYGITIGNSQNVIVKNSTLKSRRHGIAIGGDDGVTCVINRFITIQNCYLENWGELECGDIHGNSQYITYNGCTFMDGLTISGADVTIEHCKLFGTDDAARALSISHLVKGVISILNSYIFYNSSLTNATYLIQIVSSAEEDTNIRIRFINNEISVLSPNTELLKFINSHGHNFRVELINNTIYAETSPGSSLLEFRNPASVIMRGNYLKKVSVLFIADYTTMVLGEVVAEDNVILEAPLNGMACFGRSSFYIDHCLIRRNIIMNGANSGFIVDHVDNLVVSNNYIVNNGGDSTQSSYRRNNIYGSSLNNVELLDNIIGTTEGHSFAYNIYMDASFLVNKNNRFIGANTTFNKGASMQEVSEIVSTSTNLITVSYGTAMPTVGTFVKGSIVWNTSPSPGSPIGWVCTESGTPGTWVAMPNL